MIKKFVMMMLVFLVSINLVSAIDWNDAVYHWSFNETTGSNALEDVNGTNNGTLYNMENADWKAGKIGNSLEFGGTDEYINTTENPNLNTIVSLSAWIKTTKNDTQFAQIFGKQNRSGNFGGKLLGITQGKAYFHAGGTFANNIVNTTWNVTDGNWHLLVGVYNGTDALLYVDGIFNNSKTRAAVLDGGTQTFYRFAIDFAHQTFYTGSVDEATVWNASLTQTDVTELWNGGNGLAYGKNPLTVTQNSPANNSEEVLDSPIDFNITSTSLIGLSNVTIYLDGVLNETRDVSGLTNETIISIPIEILGDHNWSVTACDNSTIVSCTSSPTLNFSTSRYIENSQTFNAVSFETSPETLSINLTYESSSWSSVLGTLVYNGTSYAGTDSGSGDELIFSRQITVPEGEGNNTFYWVLSFTNASGTFVFNSSFNNQTITSITLGACGGSLNTLAINYSLWDEENQSMVKSWDFKGTFEYFVSGSTLTKNATFDEEGVDEVNVCLNINTTFIVDPVIEVSKDGFTDRIFYFNNVEFTNVTQQQRLYLLNDTLGSNIIIQIVDSGLSPLEGYYVDVQRFFPENNTYLDVVKERTDEFGQFVARLIENTVKYKFSIKNESNFVAKQTGDISIACRTTICVVQFVVEDTTDDFERFDNVTNFESNLGFNNVTNIYTVSWTDTTGDTATYRLFVERILLNGTTTVCNTTSTSSSSSMNCNVGSQKANYRAQFFRQVSGESERRISVLNVKVGDIYGSFLLEGLFWTFLVLFTLIGVGGFNPTVGAVLYLVGFIGLGMLGIISFNAIILFANVVLVVLFIWAFRS